MSPISQTKFILHHVCLHWAWLSWTEGTWRLRLNLEMLARILSLFWHHGKIPHCSISLTQRNHWQGFHPSCWTQSGALDIEHISRPLWTWLHNALPQGILLWHWWTIPNQVPFTSRTVPTSSHHQCLPRVHQKCLQPPNWQKALTYPNSQVTLSPLCGLESVITGASYLLSNDLISFSLEHKKNQNPPTFWLHDSAQNDISHSHPHLMNLTKFCCSCLSGPKEWKTTSLIKKIVNNYRH